jgi:hypothetical protein
VVSPVVDWPKKLCEVEDMKETIASVIARSKDAGIGGEGKKKQKNVKRRVASLSARN